MAARLADPPPLTEMLTARVESELLDALAAALDAERKAIPGSRAAQSDFVRRLLWEGLSRRGFAGKAA